MINRVVLVGRITRDPEVKNTNSNIAYCRFTLAVNRTFANQQGEREADFISCMVWRKQAENLARFIRKGGLIGVEGRIQTGTYQNNNGDTVYTTEVIADSIQFLEPKGSNSGQNNSSSYNSNRNNQSNNYQQNNQPSYSQGNNNYQTNNSYQQPTNNNVKSTNDPFFENDNDSVVDIAEDDLPF